MNYVRIVARDRVDQLGEGPIWSARDNAILWVDILGKRVNRLSLLDQAIDSYEQPDRAAWIIEREEGGLIAGIGRNIVRLELPSNRRRMIVEVEPALSGNRLNDAKADADGRIYFGTMPINADQPSGAFYRMGVDGSVTLLNAPYTISNGPAFDPSGRFILHTDTALGTIFRFAINDDGSLGSRVPFILFQDGWGRPDGMTFDAEGCLWVACWGAGCVARFDGGGVLDRKIILPASQITSCTFAGDALDRMFVTSAGIGTRERHGGALFEIDPGCRGLPTHRFRG